MSVSVLLVDDDEALSRSLIRQLASRSPHVEFLSAANPEDAENLLQKFRPAVCVCDLCIDESIGPESGLALVESVLRIDPTCRVIVLTGHTDNEFGIAALRAGAASFVTKPPEIEHLHALIVDGVRYSDLQRENQRLRATQPMYSAKMNDLLQQADFAASHSLPLLITGETGVGKGVLARTIHSKSGRHGQFIRVQPSHRSSELVSSELFGHERGAFTGAIATRTGLLEEADRGTLFIDEVDELPTETQILLLEALQEKRFKRLGGNREIRSDFRIIAATNRPVRDAVKAGKLREDFLHRIAQHRLEIPPLRERLEELEQLASGFVSALSEREKLTVNGITAAGFNKLRSYGWPGNIRELQAVVELATYRADADERRSIEADDISLNSPSDNDKNLSTFRSQADAYEQKLVLDALNRTGNNQSQAAKELGLDRSSFRRILARIGE